jgi:hypothetical protein
MTVASRRQMQRTITTRNQRSVGHGARLLARWPVDHERSHRSILPRNIRLCREINLSGDAVGRRVIGIVSAGSTGVSGFVFGEARIRSDVLWPLSWGLGPQAGLGFIGRKDRACFMPAAGLAWVELSSVGPNHDTRHRL